ARVDLPLRAPGASRGRRDRSPPAGARAPLHGRARRFLALELAGFYGHAAAEEVAVAVDVVRTPYRHPVLVLAQGRDRIGGERAWILVRPLVCANHGRRVRSVLERIVLPVHAALLDRADLLADRDHRVAEAVELRLRFALRRLDHERARDGERHRRSVEAVIDEALGNVLDADSRSEEHTSE